MTVVRHKLDLPRAQCSYMQVFGDVPTIEGLDALLEDNWALDSYRRSGTVHTVGVYIQTETGSEDQSLRIFWNPRGPRLAREGKALDAIEVIAQAVSTLDFQCQFEIASDHFRPKFTLPITLFEKDAFPFNQIQGYRAALVEEGKTVWSAILDRPVDSSSYHLGVHFPQYTVQPNMGFGAMLSAGVAVKDSLFVRLKNE